MDESVCIFEKRLHLCVNRALPEFCVFHRQHWHEMFSNTLVLLYEASESSIEADLMFCFIKFDLSNSIYQILKFDNLKI